MTVLILIRVVQTTEICEAAPNRKWNFFLFALKSTEVRSKFWSFYRDIDIYRRLTITFLFQFHDSFANEIY